MFRSESHSDLFCQGWQMPSGLASPSPTACVICIWLKPLMHICQRCISLESSQWKCLWRIIQNEYSCQLVPEDHLQASSLHCQSLCYKPYGNKYSYFQSDDRLWLCGLRQTQFMGIHLMTVTLCMPFYEMKMRKGKITAHIGTNTLLIVTQTSHNPPSLSLSLSLSAEVGLRRLIHYALPVCFFVLLF